MDSVGHRHDQRCCRTAYGARYPLDVLKVRVVHESFCDSYANDGGESLAKNGVSRLCERRVDSVVVKNSTRALRVAVRYVPERMSCEALTKLAMTMGGL